MSGTAHDLAVRVARAEARERIEALKATYWRAVDRGDADAVAACLTPDATIDFEGLPFFDRAEDFVATVRAAAAAGGAFHMHHGRNPVIVVESDDAASGRWDIQYRGLYAQPRMAVRMSGVYDDRYRRQDGVWRIAAMRMRQTSFLSEAIDAAGGATVALPAERTREITPSSPEARP